MQSAGRSTRSANRPPDAKDGVVLGAELARMLARRVGDTVDLSTTASSVTSAGTDARGSVRSRSSASSKFGFYQTD